MTSATNADAPSLGAGSGAVKSQFDLARQGLVEDGRDLPGIEDIASRLRFSPSKGRIWLDDKRMVLMHTSALAALRRELIESLGIKAARGLLTRMGYASGAQDAELAVKVRGTKNFFDFFVVGPQLHMLEGQVVVEPVRIEADAAKGIFNGEFIWRDSAEDEIHIDGYGIGNEPACWTLLGYASGYTSVFMGRPILYREVECRAMGHEFCRIIGKPVAEWPDADEDLQYFQPQSLVKKGDERAAPAVSGGAIRSAEQLRPPVNPSSRKMVGASAAFNVAHHMLDKVARTGATVLFLGESGVGKEMFASALHRSSERRDKPFVAVNCAAIPEHLVESELFGVEKGAFTGATDSRPGRFERADGGTLFLDEVGTLTLSAQGKLLRALQEAEIERIGGRKLLKVDVRIAAATNIDLRNAIEEGKFREDLYFRLNVFPIKIPPLRDRKADIPLLIDHFLRRFCDRHQKQLTGFTERAIEALFNYDWPGNIRELENMIERGIILGSDGEPMDLCHLFTSGENIDSEILSLGLRGNLDTSRPLDRTGFGSGPSATVDLVSAMLESQTTLDDLEAQLLKTAVERANGNLSEAARVLGITRPQLAYRLKKGEVED